MAIFERTFTSRELHDPPWFRRIFSDTRMAPLWTVARLYLGYQWLLAGWHKTWGEERWINVPEAWLSPSACRRTDLVA